MRWLFLFVLVLNFTYIIWGISSESDNTDTNIVPLTNAPSIVLLSEIEKDSATEVLTTVQKLGGQSNNNVAVSLAEQVNQEAKKASADAANANTLVVAEASDQSAKVKEVDVAIPVKKPEPIKSCFTLGPFRDLAKLSAFTREIKTYVVATDFRGREEKEPAIYWVYIKPEASYKKAEAVGKRLKAKKIKDFYIIRDGEKVNGLSLGHFRNKDGAFGLFKKVKNLGFNVVVEPIFKTYTIYWLDYELFGDKKIPEAIFDKYIKSGEKDKISPLSRTCTS